MTNPFEVAAEIVLADDTSVSELQILREERRADNTLLTGLMSLNRKVGELPLSLADKIFAAIFEESSTQEMRDTLGPSFSWLPKPEGDIRAGITAGLKEDFSASAQELEVAAVDGMSPDEMSVVLKNIAEARGPINMSPKDLQNSLDGLEKLGVTPTGETLSGMAHLIRVAANIEYGLAPNGVQPAEIKPPAQ